MIHSKETGLSQESPQFDLGLFVVDLEGEFDIAERARLLDAFAVGATARRVAVNLQKVNYIDSTVVECLVALQKATMSRGANLILTGLSPEVRRIFEVCGLGGFRHSDHTERCARRIRERNKRNSHAEVDFEARHRAGRKSVE